MNNKSGCFFSKNQQGLTLIELIVVIVILGFAASIVVAAMSVLSGVGREAQTTEYAQLAQQRMELILNEKREGAGFTGLGSCSGPDPCCLYDDLDHLDACSDKINSPEFVAFDNNDTRIANECTKNLGNMKYCRVTITVDQDQEQSFILQLYNF